MIDDPLLGLLERSRTAGPDDGKTSAELAAELGINQITVRRRLGPFVLAGQIKSKFVMRMGLKPFPIPHMVYCVVPPAAEQKPKSRKVKTSNR